MSKDYKREIREDIAETVGIQELAVYEQYNVPEKGDRKFRTEHLSCILYYLDEETPSRYRRYKYHNKLARIIERETNVSVERTDTSRVYTGFKKAELEALRSLVEEYDPSGLPEKDDVFDCVREACPPSVPDEEIRSKVESMFSHYSRQKGPEKLRRRFDAEDVETNIRLRLTVERDEEE
jgi:hypothetical protein